MKKLRAIGIACLLTAVLVSAPAAAPGPITDNLKVVVDKVLTLLKDPAFTTPEKKAERDRQIHDIASGTFDWEEMARRTLGPHWRDLEPAQQKEFIDTFSGFLERTYLSKIDTFLQGAKDFTSRNIVYQNETVEQDRYAIVETKIQLQEKDLPLNYKLIQKSGKWVIYDVSIAGVGLVANYRTQFNEILANGTFKTLMDRLRSKEGVPMPDKKTP